MNKKRAGGKVYMPERRSICKKWLEDGMCGVLPIYNEYGANISRILFYGKSPIDESRRVQTVIKDIARVFQKDIDLIKREARSISGQRTCNALPIFYDVVLIPFKVRKPIGRDDGSMGYIFESSIDRVDLCDSISYVYLKDGQKIEILDSVKTARNRIVMGQHIKDEMLNIALSHFTFGEKESIYHKIATKGDFFFFLYHLLATKDDNST